MSNPSRRTGFGGRRDSIDEIARRLDELLRTMAEAPSAYAASDDGMLEAARRIWRSRRERERIFGSILAADPAWDILLDLFIAQGEEREVTVASLSASAGVSEATVVRCVAHLAEADLLARPPQRAGAPDERLVLTDQAAAMICDYLDRTTPEAGAAAA